MTTAGMTGRIAEGSSRFRARIAGVFYLLTMLTGGVALFVRSRLGLVADLIAASCYIAATLLFYYISKPVNTDLSLLAALFSLVGVTVGALGLQPQSVDISFVFFGFYCLLIGYLIFRSRFPSRILGALMALASLAWLTFLSPPLATYLYPYNLAPACSGKHRRACGSS